MASLLSRIDVKLASAYPELTLIRFQVRYSSGLTNFLKQLAIADHTESGFNRSGSQAIVGAIINYPSYDAMRQVG